MHYFYFIRKFILIQIIIFCFGFAIAQSTDQNYPVTAQAFVVAQPGKKLSAYFSSTQALTVSLLLKDLTKTSIDVYLRWSIDGPGVRIASVDGYIPPQHFNLQRGMLQRFSGLDLQSMYFRQDVMEAQGLTGPPTRASLPEGFYTFRVQALEAGTGREVSNLGETYFSITSPLPPVINIPFNGATLASTGSASGASAGSLSLSKGLVEVQWMPRHYKLPGNITTYDLKVCKIPDGYEPQEAMDACVNPIIDDRSNPGTFFPSNTGIGNSIIGAWEQGARYAARVTVHEFDTNGEEVVFANEGRSEVTWFRYGEPCLSPESFTMKETGPGRVQLSWGAQPGVDNYKILYRPSTSSGGQGENNWKVQAVSGNTGVIQGLTKRKYEFAVQSGCTGQIPDHTQTWEMGSEDDDLEDLPPALVSPLQILVQVSGCNAVAAGNLADYYANFPRTDVPRTDVPGSGNNPVDSTKLKIPACALQSGAFADCDAELPVIPVPTGSLPLNSLRAGDVLGIYDFAAFVTEATQTPSGFSGKALVRLPFLQGALALAEFSGLKAWSAQGEGDQVRGGCVYEVSTFQLVNVSQTEVAEAKAKLLNTLAKQTDSTAFAGTLAGALLAYDRISPTATADSVCRYKTAILQATGQITDALTGLDSDHPVVAGILKDLKTIADSLQAGNIVDHITDKYEAILARLDSLKAADTDTNPSVLAIGNVQVNELTGQSARISWETTGDVAKTPSRYIIEYTDPNGATLPETVTSTQVNLQRLLPGTQYKYRITAYDGDQVLATYGEDAFTTPKKVVPTPENLAYTAVGSDSVRITWDANREHQSYKLIYTDDNGNPRILYPTTNSAILTGLVPNKYYDYEIVAYNNERLASDPASARVAAGEECKLNLSISNAGNSSLLTGNQHGISATGCNPVNNESTFFPPISWSNGTRGIVNATKNMITFADGETAMLFGGRVLIVDPIKTTRYTAICNLGSGISAKTCTYTEEIKVSSSSCVGDFKIMASSNAIKDQTESISVLASSVVELTTSRCDGKITWDQGLGDDSAIRISPTKDMIVRASCEKDGQLCYSNPISIKTQPECPKLFVKSTLYNEDHFLFLRVRRNRYVDVIASGCNGNMSWRHEGKGKVSKQGNDFYNLAEIENDVTVYAKCDESVCPEAKISVSEPVEKCNEKYLTIENTLDSRGFSQPFTLLKSTDGSKFKISDRVKSYNSTFENQVKVPALSSNNLYTADFENGCQSSILVPNQFKVSLIAENKPIEADRYDISGIQIKSGSFLTIKTTTGCPGKIIWTNDQDLTFSQNLELLNFPKPATSSKYYFPYPDVSTTYRAICLTDEGIVWPSENSKTLEVPSEKCITIKGPATADIGTVALFETTGCLGNVKWSKDGNLFAQTKSITDVVTKTTTYKAECDFPVCSQNKIITVTPCQLTVTSDKTSQKPGDELVLTATGCATTVIWQDVTGSTLGIGQELKMAPRQDIKIKVSCHLADCAFNLEVEVPKILPPKVICEELVAKAQPATIHKGELNNLILTAEGCSGGKTVWNGPGLTADAQGSGEKHTVTATGVKNTASYIVKCEKPVVGITEASVTVQATLRLTLSASPTTVEKGKTTTLRAEGCGGGTITWVDYNKTCASPCTLPNITLNEPKKFIATCTSGTDPVVTREVSVSIKEVIKSPSGTDYNSVFDQGCNTFMASVTPVVNNLTEYPYPEGTVLKLESFNCGSGSVRWETLEGLPINTSTYKLSQTTTFVAKCIKGGVVCAEAHRTAEIYTFSCGEFYVRYEQKYPGKHDFYPSWCVASSDWSTPEKSIILYKSDGQTQQIPVGITTEYDPGSIPSEAIEFKCIPDTRYRERACYFTFIYDEKAKRYNYHGKVSYSTSSRESGRVAETKSSSSQNAATVVPCSMAYPLKDLMGNYFETLVCSYFNEFRNQNKTLSQSEAQGFLDKLIPAVKADSKLKNYPIDFSTVTPQGLADAFNDSGCTAAGNLLGSAFNGEESADTYTNVIRNTFPDILEKMNDQTLCTEGNTLLADYQMETPGIYTIVSAQFNGTSRLYQFTLNDFNYTYGKNRFEIVTVPSGVDKRWEGKSYVAVFEKNNPDLFLGFYQDGYNGTCTSSYKVDGKNPSSNSQCQVLCKEGFLPVEFYRNGNKFYKDFASPTGTFYNPLNSTSLISEIDDLVESLMDQGLYDNYLKAGASKIAATNPDGKISDADLHRLKQSLLDYDRTVKSVFSKSDPLGMKKLIDFLIQCSSYQDPLNTECSSSGIVPRCFWDKGTPLPFPLSPAFAAGVIDGGADMITGFKDLFMLYAQFKLMKDCWLDPVTYIFPSQNNCGAVREQSRETLKNLGELISNPQLLLDKSLEGASVLGSEFVTWLGQVSCSGAAKNIYDNGTGVILPELYADLRCCQYKQGKLAFDVASMLYGAGEANAVAGIGVKLTSLIQVIKKVPAMMSRMNLPKVFSLKPVKTTVLALSLMFAPVEGKAFQVAQAKVVNTIEQIAFQTAETAAEKGGRVLTREREVFQGMELVGSGGEKLTEVTTKKFLSETAQEAIISVDVNNVLVALLVINKVNGVVQRISSDCGICKEKQPSATLCDKLEKLRAKGGSNGETGVKKLCANLDNNRLNDVADKLLSGSVTDEETSVFLGDAIDSKTNSQCSNREQATPDLSDRIPELAASDIDGWLVYKRGSRSCLRLDMAKLKKAVLLVNNSRLKQLKVNIDELSKITKATGDTYSMSTAVAQRMDNEVFDNLLNFGVFLENNPETDPVDFGKVITQLQTSSFYKQKGANWVIKNIASDPVTFGGKLVVFEMQVTPGIVDVTVLSRTNTWGNQYLYLIEYKSGPGATVCDYVNDDGKALGNLVRELVSRDFTSLIRDNKTLANLQWRLEQPPANFRELVRNCLMSDFGQVELENLRANGGLNKLIQDSKTVQIFIDEFVSDIWFNQIFKKYP